MKTTDIIRRAGKNLRQARARTILTSLAIGVGAFTIALAMAAGNGGRNYTNEMVETSGDMYSLNVYPKIESVDTEAESELPEYGAKEEATSREESILTEKDIEKLNDFEGVQTITPLFSFDTNYASRGEGSKKFVVPVSVKADRTEIKLAAGSLDDNMVAPGDLIMPEGFLESFGFDSAEAAIGQKIYINVEQYAADGRGTGQSKDFTFTIAAVDRESDTTLYYTEALRVSSEDSQAMYEYQRGEEASGRYYGLVVLAQDGTDVSRLQQTIKDAGYEAYGLEDMRESLLQMVNVAQWGLAAFGALAILASIFGIINTQYISVLERTQQIGLMKALGARSKDIGRLFRYEAAWIGFLGGMIGVVLAFLVTLLNPVIASVLELEEGTRLLRMDWLMSAALIVSLMLVAIISGWFPSRKAAKLDPIEALRTE